MLLSMDNEQRYFFKKEERITGDKRIEALFVSGESFVVYPLRIVYSEKNSHSSAMPKVLISIPKKRIKFAVKRNRLKRLVRESYRINKHILDDVLKVNYRHLEIAFVYVKDELTDYDKVDKAVKKALIEIKNKLETD